MHVICPQKHTYAQVEHKPRCCVFLVSRFDVLDREETGDASVRVEGRRTVASHL